MPSFQSRGPVKCEGVVWCVHASGVCVVVAGDDRQAEMFAC